MSSVVVPSEVIQNKICLVRGHKVMLDRDLAKLYGVTTGNLNKTVKRNRERFPEDFMFQLNPKESDALVFQFGRPKDARGGSRYLPYVFTEQGIAMLSSVLKSRRAIDVNITIMRAFVKLRELMMTHKDLARKIEKLEAKFRKHDKNFEDVFDAIRKLMHEDEESKNKAPLGFSPPKKNV